ncbi:MAG TPA: PQQ-dependent sugar dehydrogenase [Gemmatimonadaceae bacterium]|nr:PQQ-dependent sugar dehydrogenase [Gemmatimonadaceae bacterium]
MPTPLLLCLSALLACGDSTPPIAAVPGVLAVHVVASGLSSPLYLTAPAGDARLFIVEQGGRIRVVKNGTLLPQPYLDVSARISSGGERGLLGLAFHPAFARNGYFYVNYTDPQGNTKVERYHASPTSDVADATSGFSILAVAQPFANHNGGDVVFGADGMLYVGMGDGGSGGDPQGNGQNKSTLLGKLLRLDVDGGTPYRVPSDNPFVGQAGARGEIWALGLRNPWRFAFDRVGGTLYIADVGQGSYEEVNVVPATTAGVNYGWVIMEGLHCYNASSCNQSGLRLPVLEYDHGEGCSITGGFVYRGAAVPSLRGHYFYSDYCTGFLKSFRFANGSATDRHTWDVGNLGSVLSFGEDAAGELYILSANGSVYKIVTP